ncbi:MAG: peptidylprolyl isomerase [Candidatus Pacearchaeota archaeon]
MIKKNDFIELEFTGLVKNGEIFDTTKKDDAKKIGLKIEDHPFIICVGKEMVISGLDNSLIGKEIGEEYEIELEPKDAFQERDPSLVKLIPLKIFSEKNISPKSGMVLALDNTLVRIISVSGGRVLVDFNNPLSGKIIVYKYKILKIVEDLREKITSLFDYFLKERLKFEVKDKVVEVECDKKYSSFINMLNEKFKDALGVELIIKEKGN